MAGLRHRRRARRRRVKLPKRGDVLRRQGALRAQIGLDLDLGQTPIEFDLRFRRVREAEIESELRFRSTLRYAEREFDLRRLCLLRVESEIQADLVLRDLAGR